MKHIDIAVCMSMPVPRGYIRAVLALSFFPALSLPSQAEHSIQIRVVEQEIQIGTDPFAPSYYVQYRTPDGLWKNWSSSTLIASEFNHLWFRGQFERGEDPMAWDVPEDVDVYAASGLTFEADGEMAWTTLGTFDDDGRLIAEPPADWMAVGIMAAPPEPDVSFAPTANNQAVATPDPGRTTIYWNNRSTGQPVAWHLAVSGILKSFTPMSASNPSTAWVMEAVADIDGDGVLDLIWRNTQTGRVVIWFLDPDGWLRSAQQVLDANLSTAWRIAGAKDVDQDGVPDLIWYNVSTRHTAIWFLNNSGTRKSSAAILNSPLTPGWTVVGIGDIDKDGVPDIVWFNTSTRRSVVWFLNATGTWRETAWVTDTAVSRGWTPVGLADINQDGVPDMVWHHSTTGRVVIWFLNADGSLESAQQVLNANVARSWRIVGLSDVNGNGIADLVWHNLSTGRAAIWFLTPSGNLVTGQTVRDANLATVWRVGAVNPATAVPPL